MDANAECDSKQVSSVDNQVQQENAEEKCKCDKQNEDVEKQGQKPKEEEAHVKSGNGHEGSDGCNKSSDQKEKNGSGRHRKDSGKGWDSGVKEGEPEGKCSKDSDRGRDRKESESGNDRKGNWKRKDRYDSGGYDGKKDWDSRHDKQGEENQRKRNNVNKEKGASKRKSDFEQSEKNTKGGSFRSDKTAAGDAGSREERFDRKKKGKEEKVGRFARGGEGEGKRGRGGKNASSSEGKDHSRSDGGADLLNLLKKPSHSGDRGKIQEMQEKGKSAADLEAQWQKEEEAKQKRQEEERKQMELKRKEEEKRLEEEKQKREEEERKKHEEEEAQRLKEEEMKMLQEYIRETQEQIDVKANMRDANLKAADQRPDESYFTKLDSSLKKNTGFVKKLKNLTMLQKDGLTKDLNSLNLTKYVGEAAAAITEAKLKMSDIGCGLHICSLMHQKYADFAPALLENWQKVLLNKKDEKIDNPSKLRVDLRFFAELVAIGVFTQKEGLSVLANQLTILISNDKDEHNNLSILLSFCKHCGDDYAGLLSRKFRLLAEKYNMELPRSQFLPAERQKACRNLLKEYFSSLCQHVVKDHRELMNLEKQNRKILQTKGELSSDRKERLEAMQLAFQKLQTSCSNFADILDEDMPDLPDEEFQSEMDSVGLDLYNPMKNAEYQYEGDMTLFEDDDTRTFYENLPDLKSIIPGILYKDSANTEVEETKDLNAEASLEEDIEKLNVEDVEKEMELEHQKQESFKPEVSTESKQGNKDSNSTATEEGKQSPDDKAKRQETAIEEESAALDQLDIDVDEDTDDSAGSMKLIMDTYLQNLPSNVNRELIDKAAIEFCMNLNTKTNRKKLVRGLFTVHRTRYDLLPFYSRLVATLYPCMPDVCSDLVFVLKNDFKWHVRKKDQINIESKMKTVRFIGELVKFNMFPKSEALHCLKMLLFDFSHHNIEMACALLEACGRFLYRSPDSHHRTKVYLDVMMRKKSALHLDGRYATMIENAYYYSNPPQSKPQAVKVRPPMHEYIRKLLYKDLSKITTEKVLRQIRKISWDDNEISDYAIKCMTNIWNIRYNSIHCAANLLAGLAPYHEHVAIQVVDGVLEDIRIGMEVNHPKYNQRRVSAVKYLGELYNYRMVESAVIFKTLYTFISFGVTLDESMPSSLDPPEHLFRLRLVCVLLDTCGQYFDRGSSKKKLDCFLVYFQRYYWFKRSASIWTKDCPFPMDVQYMVQDTFEGLRPKMKLLASNEEACAAAEELDKEFRAKLQEILPTEDSNEDEAALPSIQETDEADELSQGLSQLNLADDQSSQDSDLGMDERTDSQSMSQPSRCVRPDDEGEEGNGPVEPVEEGEGDESEDIMESAGEEEEEDQFTVLTGGPKHVKCAEDEDFMAAFDQMMSENIQARMNEAVKIPQVDIAVPMHLRGLRSKAATVVPMPGSSPPADEEVKEQKDVINFVLMTKKGNKQQFTTFDVPTTTEFASKFQERAQAEKAEKERMKRVVLDIHERQEEEDYQEMLASLNRPSPANLNRERRTRYQHPKGAPDADLIFGSK